MNVQEIEAKWQKIWKANKVFVPKIDSSKEKFFITVPYPYANSALHIGHGRTFTAADIFARYQRLKGKNVLFPMGFHISGTPVLAVADAIARGDETQKALSKQAVALYEPDEIKQEKIVNSFTNPQAIANFFSSTIEKTFDAVGLSIDWTRQFTTADTVYNKFIEWQFKKLHDAGILLQGKYPILYSPVDENAVGEDDIKDGDTDKVTIQEMTYILFQFENTLNENTKEYLAIATLRPDALFGTTNAWVDARQTMCKVRVGNQIWIVTQEAVEKLNHQFDDVQKLSEHKGSEFIGKTVITPLINRPVPIADATFLDPRHGTGVAYSSPAGSLHDYLGLEEAKKVGLLAQSISVINTVDTFDAKKNKIVYDAICPAEYYLKKYNITSTDDPNIEIAKQELYKQEHYGGVLNHLCAEFAGIPIKHAKEKIFAALGERHLGGTLLETSRRAITRAGNPVIVANLQGQWFLDYSSPAVKQKAYDLLASITYNPERLRHSQQAYLEWVQKRPCARKRGLGTQLPYDPTWVIESLSDSTIYQMFYLIIDVLNKYGVDVELLDAEFFDAVFLDKTYTAKSDTKKNVDMVIIQECKKSIQYWKSFDLRYTNPPHMSNHLSFLIYHYALIFPKDLWPKNITVAGLLIKDGHKISKTKGNGIPLIQVQQQYGVDLYRLYVAVGASYDVEMDFRDEEIFQLQKRLDKLRQLIFDAIQIKHVPYEQLNEQQQWLVSRFYSRTKDYFTAMNELKSREAVITIMYELINEMNYLERRSNINQVLCALRFFVLDYLKLLTPVIPHFCEEMYSIFKSNTATQCVDEYISLATFTTHADNFIKPELETREQMIESILSNAIRMKDQRSASVIVIKQAPSERFALFQKLQALLSKTRDFKTIMSGLAEFESQRQFIQKFVPKTLGEGLNPFLLKIDEAALITTALPFIQKELGCKVILSPEESTAALPGKPSIIAQE